MRRGARIALVAAAALAVLLAVNTAVVGDQTEEAEQTTAGARILELPGGDIQVLEQGPDARPARAGRPIVLVHCYSCSLQWWDEIASLLARRHRVIRLDLLGHGGSEKPAGGYGITEQASLVAAALSELDVAGAVVVGHSMGFTVAVALAETASQLTDRLVNIGEAPTPDGCELPWIANLAYWPVLGEALWRITPDFAIEEGYQSTFAPDFDPEAAFEDPDRIVTDYRAMTFTSFEQSHEANDDYREEVPLDDRLRGIPVPLLSIFGGEDQLCPPAPSQETYGALPGARTETVPGTGHSPNVEAPRETARLIEAFAAEAEPGGGGG